MIVLVIKGFCLKCNKIHSAIVKFTGNYVNNGLFCKCGNRLWIDEIVVGQQKEKK